MEMERRRPPRPAVVRVLLGTAIVAMVGVASWYVARSLRPAALPPPDPKTVGNLADALTIVALAREVEGPAEAMLARWQGAAGLRARQVVATDAGARTVELGGWRAGTLSTRSVRRGMRVVVEVEPSASARAVVLVDLFATSASGVRTVAPEAAGRVGGARLIGSGRWEWVAPFDGEIFVTIGAPPGVASFEATVAVRTAPAYHFAVADADRTDIWSDFGDLRDGGQRIHHGIDIFAPRGTLVLAATDGFIARVGTRARGGTIVTLYDEVNDVLLYYAHLDETLVGYGERVRAGDPIATVGNTGNAITTPPHLHLGLYDGWWSRPINPWYYFVSP